MHVDGFRFDLATVLGRENYGYDKGSGFLDAINQDPTLMMVKLIAEPWDIGPGGYQLGNFPPRWCEWNDQYRDTVRRFWRGEPGVLPDFARRIHGSSDIFEHSGRRPSASINFVTSHDGYTLTDLVSYRERHNEMNQEGNRDGHNENFSENYGVEGPTLFVEVNEIRIRQRKNFLTTLLVSQGTPMLMAGDEFGRTQKGNNNAYCQDNALNWINWTDWNDDEKELHEFTRYLISLKALYPEMAQDYYIHDPSQNGDAEIHWYGPDGQQMYGAVWGQHNLKTLGYMLSLHQLDGGRARRFLVVFHAGSLPTSFTLPVLEESTDWQLLLDSSLPGGKPLNENHIIDTYMLPSYSVVILLSENRPGMTGGLF
jgi:glycogen operon protein